MFFFYKIILFILNILYNFIIFDIIDFCVLIILHLYQKILYLDRIFEIIYYKITNTAKMINFKYIYSNIIYYINIYFIQYIYINIIFPFKKYIFLNQNIEILELLFNDEMNTFYLNMYKLFKNNNFINVINKLKEILYMMRDIINIESINNIFSTISDELEENCPDKINFILNHRLMPNLIDEITKILNFSNLDNSNNINDIIISFIDDVKNIINNDDDIKNVLYEFFKIYNNNNKTVQCLRNYIDNGIISKIVFVISKNILNLYLKMRVYR
ncbi:unknown similar to AMEV236 [Choristoneura biennis entomopoxvirus]|uniref:Uncharacterized protein n=1 Tax=Choristoneura biennis entomopoxvirus TaxID=10288 RepID=A0A916NY26_CBEPV|nr:unknown similar to AMEV236 [Choristoneura biennis entomopoxvirus]CCU55842.1 unknown similar to AMEV236 [Choristoneura biennis entomopoxvirus]